MSSKSVSPVRKSGRQEFDRSLYEDSSNSLNTSREFDLYSRTGTMRSQVETSHQYATYSPSKVRKSTPVSLESTSKLSKEMGRLQNQISILKKTYGEDAQPGTPIYLIPSELFYMLREALLQSFTTIEQHLILIGEGNRPLTNRLRDLQSKTTLTLKDSFAITAEMMSDLLEYLAESEVLQNDIYAFYSGTVEKVAGEMTNLLAESFKVLRALVEKSSRFEDDADLTIWNEKRMALANELPSLSLVSLQRALLQDFETIKQRLIAQILGIKEFMTVEKPGYMTPIGKSMSFSPDSRLTRLPTSPGNGDELRFSLKQSFTDVFEALNHTKAEVGKWTWQESPLGTRFAPRVEAVADIEAAMRTIKHDIDEIAKVVTTDRKYIENKLLHPKSDSEFTDMKIELATSLEVQRKLQMELIATLNENAELHKMVEKLQAEIVDQTEVNYKYEMEIRDLTGKMKVLDRLRSDNKQLSSELEGLKSSHAHQSALFRRLNLICGLPEASTIVKLESILRDFAKTNFEEEKAVMDIWELPMTREYRQCKFLGSYANNQENMTLALRYLIEKTEEIMKVVDGGYEGKGELERMQVQELEKLEYKLLEGITGKIAEMKVENEQLRKASETNELTINFNGPSGIDLIVPSNRLCTDISIEERLSKGLYLLCEKAAAVGNCDDPIPEEPIDQQKYIFDLLDKIQENPGCEEDKEIISQLEAEKAALCEQLEISEVQISLESEEISEETRPTCYGISLEEKLVRGFDLANRKTAETLGKTPIFADTLFEQQKVLLENVSQLCTALQKKASFAASSSVNDELDELLKRVARAINVIPILPPMISDKVLLLKDFVYEFVDAVEKAQPNKKLKDYGLTYKVLHGSNELLQNRLSL